MLLRKRPEAPNGIKPVRRPLEAVGIVVVLVLAAMLINALITNPTFEWDIVAEFVFDKRVLWGVVVSLYLTVIAMVIAIVLGTGLAIMALSSSRLLVSVAWLYTWVFRSIPVLVQLVMWYNFGALYKNITFGIPFGPEFVSFPTNEIISRLGAAILGLGLAQAAYSGEVIRAGIQSVPKGQVDAARAVGMKPSLAFRRVVFPQAMRLIIPPVGNEVVSMIKNTSLVSVIALAELFYTAQLIYAENFKTIPLLVVACLWYLALVSVFTFGQSKLEKKYGKGVNV